MEKAETAGGDEGGSGAQEHHNDWSHRGGENRNCQKNCKTTSCPFVKVEVTKFTEVGYVGRDVESMVRDLVHIAVQMVREEEEKKVMEKARSLAEERLIDLLVPPSPRVDYDPLTREKLLKKLRDGALDERLVEIEVEPPTKTPSIEIFAASGLEEIEMQLRDMLSTFSNHENMVLHHQL